MTKWITAKNVLPLSLSLSSVPRLAGHACVQSSNTIVLLLIMCVSFEIGIAIIANAFDTPHIQLLL